MVQKESLDSQIKHFSFDVIGTIEFAILKLSAKQSKTLHKIAANREA